MIISSTQDLDLLISNKIPESKEIDYKESLSLTSQQDRLKFLYNFTSFANAVGGSLIYGIKENEGFPIEAVGIDIQNIDELKLQIDNIIRDLVEPRFNNYTFTFIPLNSGKQVLVISIDKTWNGPHAVKINKSYSFYSRNSAGKFPLDIFEIRNSFLESSTQIENAKSFKIKRISEIIAGDTPLPLDSNKPSKLIVHAIPLNAFNPSTKCEIRLIDDYANLKLVGSNWFGHQVNFEGMLLYSGYQNSKKEIGNYTQIYRNGIIEAVDLVSVNYSEEGYPKMSLVLIEDAIKGFIKSVFDNYKIIGAFPPILLAVSFLDVKEKQISLNEFFRDNTSSKSLAKENYFLPELLIESFDENWIDKIDEILLTMWNAFGLSTKIK
jgi:hypothetical protein